jgi:hypothetical protein
MTVTTNNCGAKNSLDRMVSPLSRIGWVSLILSSASTASAFHSSAREPFAMIQTTSPGSLQEDCTEFYRRGSDARKHFSTPHSRKSSSVSTRLQYRDGNDNAPTVDLSRVGSSWWSTIFASQPEASKGDQDVVDEYLEFLDRRYRRLHSDEKEEENVKPFSAVNWLRQGSPKLSEVIVSPQQQEDALYVLGVAGLASEKLLQKHSLPVEIEHKTGEPRASFTDVIDVTSENESASAVFIQKVMVPVLRVLYVAQRRKELFVNSQLRRFRSLLSRRAKSVAESLILGPVTTMNAVLEIGGGKKNIALTLAAVSTVLLLLHPVLQVAVTEGSVSP